MATYKYINKQGVPVTIDAPSPEIAISSAKDIDPSSGVQLVPGGGNIATPSVPSSTPPGTQAPVVNPNPSPTAAIPDTPPSGLFGANASATGNTQFANVLQTAVDRLGVNNQLSKQKNLLVKALYDSPLTPDELAQLPPEVRSQVQSYNPQNPDPAMRANLEMQLRLTNDSIAGRNGSMNQSIKFLVDNYTTSLRDIEKQKQDAIDNVLKFASAYGSQASAAMKSLYGEEYVQKLKDMGINVDNFFNVPTLNETRYGTGDGNFTVNIPQDIGNQKNQLAYKNNNPGNLRFAGQDGATLGASGFAKFETPEAGYQALLSQIQLDQTRNLTVAQFINKYAPPSENDTPKYIKDFTTSLGVPDTTNIKDLSTEDMADFIMQKESGSTREKTESDIQVQADAIERGDQPPPNPATGRTSVATQKLFAELSRRGVNITKAYLDYQAALKTTQSLNGPQMIRFRGLAQSVVNTIDEVKVLTKEMDNSGITKLNQAGLLALTQTAGNTEKGQLASKYLAAVNTLKEEFANLANGGYAPTEAAFSLANSQINGNYGAKQLAASLDEVQRLINYRVNALTQVQPLSLGGADVSSGQNDPLGLR